MHLTGVLAHGGANVPPKLTFHELLVRWNVEPVPLLVVLVPALLYAWGIYRLAAKGTRWPLGRTISFSASLIVAAYATMGGLAAYDTILFSSHMAQHILLAMVVPALLALSAPITLALRAANPALRARIMSVLHSRFAKVIAFPPLGLALFAGTPFVFYFSGAYPLTVDNAWVHYLSHVHFVMVGCIFFWPILGIDPIPGRAEHGVRVLSVFLAMPMHAFLGLVLLSSTTVFAGTHYESLLKSWGGSLLADQQTGAALMWASGEVTSGFLLFTVLVQWARADRREAKRTDRHLDRLDAIAAREADELEAYNERLRALAERG